MNQRVIISHNLEEDLTAAINDCERDRIFVLTDTTTVQLCWPVIKDFPCLAGATVITIGATDMEKTLDSTAHVWGELQKGGATRHSLLINLGGGMVTDLGGFAASTFKRGINFINIPTTLLSMVDASVGGKTGINFGGLKNEIGVFNDSKYVILCTEFLKTLDDANMRSGYAEMLKHALINREPSDHPSSPSSYQPSPSAHQSSPSAQPRTAEHAMWQEHLSFDITNPDLNELQRMVAESVAVKEAIVEEDPHEHGIRKALNLGHTVGHAFESWAMRHASPTGEATGETTGEATGETTGETTGEATRETTGEATRETTGETTGETTIKSTGGKKITPILHGYAVAFGIIPELYLACTKVGFPEMIMRQVVRYIHEVYGTLPITCDDYPELIELMTHDKKNIAGVINFTLLGGIGDIRINQTATTEEIKEALDFFREG